METGVIYKITCTGNGMYLYGSTLFFKDRMKSYINAFKRGDYKNSILQRSIDKYGIESFSYKVVQDNIPEDILEAVEDIWIGANCSRSDDRKGGMNIRDAQRFRHSEETKEKIRKSKEGRFLGENNHMFGKKLSEEHKQKISNVFKGKPKDLHKKKALQYDINGNFLQEWDSQIDAAKYYNIDPSGIAACIKENRQYYGFQWKRFENNYPLKIDRFTGINQYGGKTVAQIDIKTGQILEYYNTAVAVAQSLGISHSTSITKCATGKKKTAHGYKWKYV